MNQQVADFFNKIGESPKSVRMYEANPYEVARENGLSDDVARKLAVDSFDKVEAELLVNDTNLSRLIVHIEAPVFA